MKRRRKNQGLINQMNVVPYIDVMLVLLVIFMVTTPMFVPSIINLPSVGHASQVSSVPIQINIDQSSHYSITQNNQTTNVADVDSLVRQVKSMASSQNPVVVSADKNIRYNDVITVVDKLYLSGIKKVALVVKERNG